MWASLITIGFEVGLKVLGWFLDKSAANKKIKEEFFDWVRKAGEDMKLRKTLHYADEKLKELKETPWQETK